MQFHKTLFVTLLAALFMTPVADAAWVHAENAIFRAERAGQKHPSVVDQMIVLPQATDSAMFCVAYGRTVANQASGRVATRVLVEAVDGKSRKFKQVARVSDNFAIKCRDLGELGAGSTIHMRHRFKKMPRLGRSNGLFDQMAVVGLISTVGRPELEGSVLAPPTETTPLGLLQSEESGWFTSANSLFIPEQNGEKHPQSLDRMIIVPAETGARPLVCAAYDRGPEAGATNGFAATAARPVITKVRIARQGAQKVERIRLGGTPVNGTFLQCKRARGKLSPGDIVSFESKFRNLSNFVVGSYADMIAAISTSGPPTFGTRPVPEPEPEPEPPVEEEGEDENPAPDNGGDDGGNSGGGSTPPPPTAPPPPPAPPSGGGLSSADYSAAGKVFGCLCQLHRPAPGSWEIIGTKTKLGSNGKVDPRTAGYGGSIAAALADYERKQGSLSGNPRSLSSTDRSALAKFAAIRSSGPTGIRMNRQGKYMADVYRRNLGVRIGGPFNTLNEAVNFLLALGI